jgi:hypothetical protein
MPCGVQYQSAHHVAAVYRDSLFWISARAFPGEHFHSAACAAFVYPSNLEPCPRPVDALALMFARGLRDHSEWAIVDSNH